MFKRTCSFTEPQAEYLNKLSAELGISFSDLVRRIVDEHRMQRMAVKSASQEEMPEGPPY